MIFLLRFLHGTAFYHAYYLSINRCFNIWNNMQCEYNVYIMHIQQTCKDGTTTDTSIIMSNTIWGDSTNEKIFWCMDILLWWYYCILLFLIINQNDGDDCGLSTQTIILWAMQMVIRPLTICDWPGSLYPHKWVTQ